LGYSGDVLSLNPDEYLAADEARHRFGFGTQFARQLEIGLFILRPQPYISSCLPSW